jgi:hypothetical protein
MLQKGLVGLCAEKRLAGADRLRELDRLQTATIEKEGKRNPTRTHVEGQVDAAFQAANIAPRETWHD